MVSNDITTPFIFLLRNFADKSNNNITILSEDEEINLHFIRSHEPDASGCQETACRGHPHRRSVEHRWKSDELRTSSRDSTAEIQVLPVELRFQQSLGRRQVRDLLASHQQQEQVGPLGLRCHRILERREETEEEFLRHQGESRWYSHRYALHQHQQAILECIA